MKARSQTTLDVIIFFLMSLFIYAAVFKLLGYESFIHYVDTVFPFGKYMSLALASGIPLTELCVAGMLLIPRFRLIGLYAYTILMLAFTAYMGYYAIISTEHRPC